MSSPYEALLIHTVTLYNDLVPIDAGAWQSGTDYERGDLVSASGQYFIAQDSAAADVEPPEEPWLGADELVDGYGDVKDLSEIGVDSIARVEQVSEQELLVGRDTLVTVFKIFLPAGAPITGLTRVVWNDSNYRVKGHPAIRDGRFGPHHVEAVLESVSG